MLKIGVISDTHWGSFAEADVGAQRLLHSVFSGVDVIIHAGDMQHPDVDLAFSPHAFYAVRGNMDAASADTPLKRIIKLCNVNIGVIHGWGTGTEIEANAASEFDLHRINVLIYGHSHYPACHARDGVLFFNPGSAVQPRRAPNRSVGLIRIYTNCSAPESENKRGSDCNRCRKEALSHMPECMIETRHFISYGKQQVIAEIINIDAVPEIV